MKRIVCILISCVLLTTIWIQGPCAYANTASGECGQETSSIVWYFDTSTGTLEIEAKEKWPIIQILATGHLGATIQTLYIQS